MEAIKYSTSEHPVNFVLPKENTSGCVTKIPISVAKRWVDRLTDNTLCGKCGWVLQGGSAELHLADDVLFTIRMFKDGIVELEISVVTERWMSSRHTPSISTPPFSFFSAHPSAFFVSDVFQSILVVWQS
jgi:hypothetical protein